MSESSTKVEHGKKTSELKKLGQPPQSHIRHVIAVMSGKGGVGKSSIAALAASELARRNYSVGVLDADITGPSIPKLFGVKGTPTVVESYLLPERTSLGIRIMSLNLLLEREDDPVIWRGPLIAGAVRQFWTDVLWGDVDYLIIDLPPGTGDSPLTVLQTLPVDGVVIVSTPQELTVMVVKKAVNMTKMLNVPVLGLVENMAWVKCPKCGEKIEAFGRTKARDIAEKLGLKLIGSLPIDPRLSILGDRGKIEEYRVEFLGSVADLVDEKASQR